MPTVADTIRDLTREHLLTRNGLLFAQCVTAVGWIGGTVPELTEADGIVELPTSDVSNSGIVVGAALAGRRPIYVIRYQGFMWYNAASLVNYAAKSKYLWDTPCPVFVRALGMENHMGPVASGMFHGLVMHMPGMPVAAPVTPAEWRQVWQFFLAHDDPVYCSECRHCFGIDYEMEDRLAPDPEVTVFAVSLARLRCAAIGLPRCNLSHVLWLKPTCFSPAALASLGRSKFGVVVDPGYTSGGASQVLAYELMHRTGRPVFALGLADRTSGFAQHCDNVTPGTEEIVRFIKDKLDGL